MKIRVLVVDDEPLARAFIRQLLNDDSDVEIVGESGNGRDAAKAIAELSPDLVFLDVQMPEMDGLSLLKSLPAGNLPSIVFTTAYEQYAIQAFEFHAIDYLLKPFDQERFKRALDFAKQRLTNGEQRQDESVQLTELVRSIETKPRYLDRLLIKTNGRIVFLRASEIDWVRADDKYVHLNFGKRTHMVRQTLSALKEQLDPATFVQVNRSAIVNIERIRELQPMFSGDYSIILEDNTEIPLSRSFKSTLFDLLGKPL